MPDIRFDFAPWPIGTVVGAYQRKSELHMDDMPPPAIPRLTQASVQTDQSLTLSGLGVGSYWAIAPKTFKDPFGGPDQIRYQYVSFELR